jgi:hypothetical protein
MTSRSFTTVLLLLLVLCAGCQTISLTGSEPSPSDPLAYDSLWKSSENAIFHLEKNQYQAVYYIENESKIELYRIHRINTKKPLDLTDVQFRYPNGTIIFEDKLSIERSRFSTSIILPSSPGKVGFTSPRSGKSFQAPVIVTGNYTVILPHNSDISISLLSKVSPSNYTTTLPSNQLYLHWKDPSSEILYIQYYLVRDSQLLAALLIFCGTSLLLYSLFFFLQMKRITKNRFEADPPL